MSIKKILMTNDTAVVFVPHNRSAEKSDLENKLTSMVKRLAEGAETGSERVAAREAGSKNSHDVEKSGLNMLEDELIS